MAILVTGGAGYIGSHAVRILKDRNTDVVAVDNLVKGHKQAVGDAKLYIGDVADIDFLRKIFAENKIDTVMHFAAYSLVGESEKMPYIYYKNNIDSSLNLLAVMLENNVKKIVFSSSAATYGMTEKMPIKETDLQSPVNTYGETKLAIERMLACFDRAHGIKHIALRYFNVAGAYKTGEIGEDHKPETHLIPIVLSVANKKRKKIQIYGNDYKTNDGTNIRDYIHVEDLIDAHIKSADYLEAEKKSDCFNLGSSDGYSNLEIINAAKQVTGIDIPYEFAPRRSGDPDILIASSEKAEKILGWRKNYNKIDDIISSAWLWHKNHPDGFYE